MTQPRKLASLEAGQVSFNPQPDRRERARILRQGAAMLAFGAVLTWGSIALANGPLGLLSLLTVLGGLTWTSLRLLRNLAAGLNRRS